jgi:hypothetical protein
MLKGKNLFILAGVAVVGYYLYKKNQNKKVVVNRTSDTPSTSLVNFTGDLGVPQYQNADGDFLSQQQLARLRRIAANNPQRAQKVAARMTSRLR